MLVRVWYLLQPSSRFSDSNIYLAMGQGILNGLLPYVDMFETKPPGMYYLSAASLRLFGNGMLGNWLAVAGLLGIPFALSCRVLRVSQQNRGSLALFAFVGSALLVVYTSIQALPWQTELFGALLGMLYVMAIAWQPLSRTQIGIASFTLFCAVGLKEPFLLSLLAAAMILSTSIATFVRSFLLPLCLATTVGVITLLALGILHPYLTIYLETMTHHSVASQVPLLERGLRLDRFYFQWLLYSPLLPLDLIAWGICIGVCHRSDRVFQNLRTGAFAATRFLAALYIAALSAGIAGTFNTQHFAFPIPAYFAVFICCLQSIARHSSLRWTRHAMIAFVGLAFISLLATSYFTDAAMSNTATWKAFRQSVTAAETQEHRLRTIAASIDGVMDRCQIDRYFLAQSRSGPLYGFTRHSPLNYFIFATFPYEFLDNPAFEAKTIDRLNIASILIADTGGILLPASPLGTKLLQTLTDDFTTTAWACAGTIDVAPYHVFFRKRVADVDVPSIPVALRTFDDYALQFPKLTALADYQFDELRYATWREFKLQYPYQDLHFAVDTGSDLIVYLYNQQSHKFESRIVFEMDRRTVRSFETNARGFAPPMREARMR